LRISGASGKNCSFSGHCSLRWGGVRL
jgi:hypothetical protein